MLGRLYLIDGLSCLVQRKGKNKEPSSGSGKDYSNRISSNQNVKISRKLRIVLWRVHTMVVINFLMGIEKYRKRKKGGYILEFLEEMLSGVLGLWVKINSPKAGRYLPLNSFANFLEYYVGPDLCLAVEWFFHHASFPVGCNSSFIALIPKTLNPKSVACLLTVNLDGPFIINELLARCHHKKHSAMVFKIDFAKAYDSIRWDYLGDVLKSFGFGVKWCSWIRGILNSSMASILVNGSPTKEFQFHRGLKQGDPLAPYLFIIIMESLHLSFSRVIEAGIFTGIKIDSSMTLSHLFYADDAVFIGEWSRGNLTGIMHTLRCFSLLSGLSINLKKSQKLLVLRKRCLRLGHGTKVISSRLCLSSWKLKTLSIGGRLTLLKSVLGSTPIYNMSLFKVPKAVLKSMESIRRNFFNGIVMERIDLLGLAGLRGGEESAQLSRISDLLDTVVLSNMGDRRFWDLNGGQMGQQIPINGYVLAW
ncbi:RNA-directed DNA polymerase, eukaryota [Tanacetum coccineum]|uniref:RNA-directed DNA polymerase, eukaryota n=1 Tax=Tanacetum coccineum TaxID=301880 RepID=A0ABQ5ECI6_9ASTR